MKIFSGQQLGWFQFSISFDVLAHAFIKINSSHQEGNCRSKKDKHHG